MAECKYVVIRHQAPDAHPPRPRPGPAALPHRFSVHQTPAPRLAYHRSGRALSAAGFRPRVIRQERHLPVPQAEVLRSGRWESAPALGAVSQAPPTTPLAHPHRGTRGRPPSLPGPSGRPLDAPLCHRAPRFLLLHRAVCWRRIHQRTPHRASCPPQHHRHLKKCLGLPSFLPLPADQRCLFERRDCLWGHRHPRRY